MRSKKQLKEDWNDLECVRDMFKSSMVWIDNLKKGLWLYRIALVIAILTNITLLFKLWRSLS